MLACGPHAQHLVGRHEVEMPDPEQGGEGHDRQGRGGEPQAHGRRQHHGRTDHGCMGVVVAVDEAADRHSQKDRKQGEGGWNDPVPDDVEMEFHDAVGRGDAHQTRNDLYKNAMRHQRPQKRMIDARF